MEPELNWIETPCSAEAAQAFACHQPPIERAPTNTSPASTSPASTSPASTSPANTSPLEPGPIDTVPLAIKQAPPSTDLNMGQKYFDDMELLDTSGAPVAAAAPGSADGGANAGANAGADGGLLLALIIAGGLLGLMFASLAPLGASLSRFRGFLGFGGIIAFVLVAAAFFFAWTGGFGILLTVSLIALGGASYLAVRELLDGEAAS